jgi:hypothetical protein
MRALCVLGCKEVLGLVALWLLHEHRMGLERKSREQPESAQAESRASAKPLLLLGKSGFH